MTLAELRRLNDSLLIRELEKIGLTEVQIEKVLQAIEYTAYAYFDLDTQKQLRESSGKTP